MYCPLDQLYLPFSFLTSPGLIELDIRGVRHLPEVLYYLRKAPLSNLRILRLGALYW